MPSQERGSRKPRGYSTSSNKPCVALIPAAQLDNIVDNIGLPFSGINMAYQNTGTIGPEDGDALISLKEDHAPTADYIKQLRTILPRKFPGTTFSFLPADIVSQILNFGLPAPIDVQVVGNNQKANYAYATDLLKRIRLVPGLPICESSKYSTTHKLMSM